MITVLAFVVTLGLLIVVHEYGHYRVAVACGVKVLRFSVGFGRTLWSRRRGETEFVVAALPLGGYVRMLDEREAPVPPHELHRAFNRQSLARRTAIVAAGPIANLLLAVLLYACAHWIGIEEPKAVLGSPTAGSVFERAGVRAGDWVRAYADRDDQWHDLASLNDLQWQVIRHALNQQPMELLLSDAQGRGQRRVTLDLDRLAVNEIDADSLRRIGLPAAFRQPVVGQVIPGGPAAAAGLRPGDRIESIDGAAIVDAQPVFERIRAAVRDGAGVPMHWRVLRGGETVELTVTPRAISEGQHTFGRIEAALGGVPERVLVRSGPIDGLVKGVRRTWDMSVLSLKMLGRIAIGEASVRNLSGPLTIADAAGQSARQGFVSFIGFLAVVSLSIGVLNLLPLPMLDGGHLMYYLFEAVTGRPVSDLWLARLQRGGVAILLLVMSVALYNDVARLLGLQ
ncbi:MAG: RIP metalloprotease RseP [Ideonella sp.]|nr:MAG: RIP metalloprotease RseP [Burkholderiaceae bacterium]MBE7425231.1 RIP metalloprotease RseP [Ideonella sp.]